MLQVARFSLCECCHVYNLYLCLKRKCTAHSLFKLGLKCIAPQESWQFKDSFMSTVLEGSVIDDFGDVRAIRTCR